MNGLVHRSKQHLYSITPSASASSVGGMSRSSFSIQIGPDAWTPTHAMKYWPAFRDR